MPAHVHWIAAALSVASLVGCGGAVATKEVPPADAATAPSTDAASSAFTGEFGYQGLNGSYDAAEVTASINAATYDFDCLHGNTGPIVLDANGAFSTQGTLVTTGGEIETFPNATFAGTVAGGSLVLTVSWSTSSSADSYGPVTFTKDLVPTQWAGCI